jgi:hypothetical protein
MSTLSCELGSQKGIKTTKHGVTRMELTVDEIYAMGKNEAMKAGMEYHEFINAVHVETEKYKRLFASIVKNLGLIQFHMHRLKLLESLEYKDKLQMNIFSDKPEGIKHKEYLEKMSNKRFTVCSFIDPFSGLIHDQPNLEYKYTCENLKCLHEVNKSLMILDECIRADEETLSNKHWEVMAKHMGMPLHYIRDNAEEEKSEVEPEVAAAKMQETSPTEDVKPVKPIQQELKPPPMINGVEEGDIPLPGDADG